MLRDRAAAAIRRPELIPGLLAIAAFIVTSSSQGGFAATNWGPAGIFLLGLLAIACVAYRDRLAGLEPANRLALILLAAFVAWNFASIAWAEVQGTAWDGANRALIYLIVYALFSLIGWRAGSGALVFGAYSAGLAVLGAIVLLEAYGSGDAGLSLINGRLAQPTGYPNAVAALFIGGFWPAVFLASRKETWWPLRGVMLAMAGFLLQMALMPQSRGSLLVFPLALVLYLIVVPNRIRALIALLAVAAATTAAASPILDVFSTVDSGGDPGEAIAAAGDAMLLSCAFLLVVGLVVAFADRRVSISDRTAKTAGRVGAAVAALLATAAAVAALVAIGNPVEWGGDRWEDFKAGYDEGGFGESRFSGDLGSARYDFWKVALEDEFADSPVVGAGSDNFAVAYVQNRESDEEPLYPHSLPIRVLAGTGLVGGLLLIGFAISACVSAVRSRRRLDTTLGRGLAAVALTATGYFALHSSGDWLWTFTALTMPVFAWLGLVAGMAGGRPSPADAREGEAQGRSARPGRVGLAAMAATAGVLAALSFALPWGAARYTDSAANGWPADREAALSRLETARDLNFLSARADLVAGTIALRSDDMKEAEAAFANAVEREPTNWYALLELGTLRIIDGDRDAGLAFLERASSLNPTEPLIAAAMRRARSRTPLPPERIDSILLDRVCSRVGATQETRYCLD